MIKELKELRDMLYEDGYMGGNVVIIKLNAIISRLEPTQDQDRRSTSVINKIQRVTVDTEKKHEEGWNGKGPTWL